jgi:hypothetical protein
MEIVELLFCTNDEEIAEYDLNLYNALIEHPDVMERMGNKPLLPADDPNHCHPHDCGYTVTGHIHNCNCKPECVTPHDETPKQVCTCTGSCRGKEGLGEGWICALEAKPNVQAHLRVGERKL